VSPLHDGNTLSLLLATCYVQVGKSEENHERRIALSAAPAVVEKTL
jgi:hypothetical protein